MNVERTLSRTATDALTHLMANERRQITTHRTAMHAATRESLIGRGLIEQYGSFSAFLRLTDEGRAVAEGLER